jgi:hypothetical protein
MNVATVISLKKRNIHGPDTKGGEHHQFIKKEDMSAPQKNIHSPDTISGSCWILGAMGSAKIRQDWTTN